MVYYNNNGQINAYASVEVYEQHVRYDSDGNDVGMVLVELEEAQAITAATQAAATIAREAALTLPERFYMIEGLASSIVDLECKDEKYFYGIGFTHGRKSVLRFPTHEDSIKLLAWEASISSQIEAWVQYIKDGPVDPSAFNTVFVAENLPKIEDF